MSKVTKLKLKQIRSEAGRLPKHKATLRGLGLRHLNHEVVVDSTLENCGMIQKVLFMLKVEEVK